MHGQGYEETLPSGFQKCCPAVLQHEAADAGAGIQRGEDEQHLEHDGEVVPHRQQPLPKALLKMLAMPTASDGAPPVRANRVFSPISLASMLHLIDR